MFASAENATDLDLIDDDKSNGGGYSSDYDAENSTNQRDNDEEEIDPYRLENLLLDDSDDDLTEHHVSAVEALSQLIRLSRRKESLCRWKRRMHKRQDGFGVLLCLNFLFLQLWTVRWF